jgi:hypothetical protein
LPFNSSNLWERGSRAVFEPAFRGIEGINAGHKATLDAVRSGEREMTPPPYAGSMAHEYKAYNPDKWVDARKGLKSVGNAVLGAGRENAGLGPLFDMAPEAAAANAASPENGFSSTDIDEAIVNSEGIASLTPEDEFVGPPAPRKTPQEKGLNDAAVQGPTATPYNTLMGMYGQKQPPVPDYSSEIDASKNAAYSAMLMQLGAGIMRGDMASGVEKGGAALTAGNKETRQLSMASKQAQYEADRADRAQDIQILGKAGLIQAAEAKNKVDTANRTGITMNSQLGIVKSELQAYAKALEMEGIVGEEWKQKMSTMTKSILEGRPDLQDMFPYAEYGMGAGANAADFDK